MRLPEVCEADKYIEYIKSHVSLVNSIYHERLKPVLVSEGISEEMLAEIEKVLSVHDSSKFIEPEFTPYLKRFIDRDNHSRDDEEYLLAMNLHIMNNPHHWQYWCLLDDFNEIKLKPINIPFQYIIEMLCDWEAAGIHYGNTAHSWYSKQKDIMILTESTRKTLEHYLEYLK